MASTYSSSFPPHLAPASDCMHQGETGSVETEAMGMYHYPC